MCSMLSLGFCCRSCLCALASAAEELQTGLELDASVCLCIYAIFFSFLLFLCSAFRDCEPRVQSCSCVPFPQMATSFQPLRLSSLLRTSSWEILFLYLLICFLLMPDTNLVDAVFHAELTCRNPSETPTSPRCGNKNEGKRGWGRLIHWMNGNSWRTVNNRWS